MSMFTPENTTVQDPSLHTVHRPHGGIDGLREIRDSAGRLMVTVVPLGMARRLSVAFEALAACCVLVGEGKVHIGQSHWMGKRSLQQAADPGKGFAGEVYMIHAQHEDWLFRAALPYLEHRLTEIAREAGLLEVTHSASAQASTSSDERAIFEGFVGASLRLLFDAGCRAFTRPASQLEDAAEADSGLDPAEEEPAQIDVDDVPSVGGELALDDGGLWARGYHSAPGTRSSKSCGRSWRRSQASTTAFASRPPSVSSRRPWPRSF
jgi:hypothetical protein